MRADGVERKRPFMMISNLKLAVPGAYLRFVVCARTSP